MYSDWKVDEFDSKNLILSQDIDGYCDEHFVLKLGENNIEVFKCINKGREEFYKDTNISKDYLTSSDINKLENGIYVYGFKNLNSVLEDFE